MHSETPARPLATLSLLPLLLFLSACIGVIGNTTARTLTTPPGGTPCDVAPTEPPQIKVSPESISLTLAPGTTALGEIEISNTGGQPLTFELSANVGAFRLGMPSSGTVAPCGKASVSFVASCPGGSTSGFNGSILVKSNSAFDFALQIPVSINCSKAPSPTACPLPKKTSAAPQGAALNPASAVATLQSSAAPASCVCPDGSTRISTDDGGAACACKTPDQTTCSPAVCYTDSGAVRGKASVLDMCMNGHFPSGFDSTSNYVGTCAQKCIGKPWMCVPAGGCRTAGVPVANAGGIIDQTFVAVPADDVLCVCGQ